MCCVWAWLRCSSVAARPEVCWHARVQTCVGRLRHQTPHECERWPSSLQDYIIVFKSCIARGQQAHGQRMSLCQRDHGYSYRNSIWLKGELRVHQGKVEKLVPCRDSCPRCAYILVGPRSQCFPAQQRRTSSLRFLQNPAALTVRQHRRMQYTYTVHHR